MATVLTVIALCFAAIASWNSPFASASASRVASSNTCENEKGKTLLANRQARVYVFAGTEPPKSARIFGCLFSVGRPWQLNAVPRHSVFGEARGISVDDASLILKDQQVAYPEYFYGVDSSVLAVTTKSLRTGQVTYCKVGFRIAPSRTPKVSGIELTRRGSVAWIGRSRPQHSSGRDPLTPEVGACDSTGSHILEAGEQIDLHSLALRGSTLSWENAGVVHTAVLD